ncbi:MAG TPA: PepSY domain-containing protein [Hyphomicrobium sp.]|nr:PepSY domain-containing protein [Hyphomicrobium sp.]
MRNTALLTAIGLLAIATPALAEKEEGCTKAPREQWLSDAQIKSKLAERGYSITKIEVDDTCIEVKGTDKDGKKVELDVDPVTAEIVKTDD